MTNTAVTMWVWLKVRRAAFNAHAADLNWMHELTKLHILKWRIMQTCIVKACMTDPNIQSAIQR